MSPSLLKKIVLMEKWHLKLSFLSLKDSEIFYFFESIIFNVNNLGTMLLY
jgi:hypothetical protein